MVVQGSLSSSLSEPGGGVSSLVPSSVSRVAEAELSGSISGNLTSVSWPKSEPEEPLLAPESMPVSSPARRELLEAPQNDIISKARAGNATSRPNPSHERGFPAETPTDHIPDFGPAIPYLSHRGCSL